MQQLSIGGTAEDEYCSAWITSVGSSPWLGRTELGCR